MTYEEAVTSEVSRQEAQYEIAQHCGTWNDFVAEHGDKQTYKGSEVLGWLGY